MRLSRRREAEHAKTLVRRLAPHASSAGRCFGTGGAVLQHDGGEFDSERMRNPMKRKTKRGQAWPNSTSHRKYELQVVMEVDEDGKYVAWCPALQACYTQGDTFEEAMANIEEVIAICLEELHEAKKPVDLRLPEVIGTRRIEITV